MDRALSLKFEVMNTFDDTQNGAKSLTLIAVPASATGLPSRKFDAKGWNRTTAFNTFA